MMGENDSVNIGNFAENENTSTVYDFCKHDATVSPYLWRDAFIAKICAVNVPNDVPVFTLTPDDIRKIEDFDYNESLEQLLILFGAGYIDVDTLRFLAERSDEYSEIIRDMEECVITQSVEPVENQISKEILKELLECVVNAKSRKEMKDIGFETARRLYNNANTRIKNGYVYVRNPAFLEVIFDCDEPMGAIVENNMLKVFTSESARLNFTTPEDKNKPFDQIIDECGNKNGLPNMPFLLNLRNAEQILEIYSKTYAAEFIKYAKERHIVFDDDFSAKYDEFVKENKMRFQVSFISRKREICGDEINWFDYCNTEYSKEQIILSNDFDKTEIMNLTGFVKANEHLSEIELVQRAAEVFCKNRELQDKTVIEITYSGKKYLYLLRTGNEIKTVTPLDSDSFRIVPFEYNNLWTLIMEWVRGKKITKIDDEVTIPKSEWEKVPPKERKYAKRLIEEQYYHRNNQNRMLQKLSELKSNARNKAEKDEKRSIEQNKLKDDKDNREKGVVKDESSGS